MGPLGSKMLKSLCSLVNGGAFFDEGSGTSAVLSGLLARTIMPSACATIVTCFDLATVSAPETGEAPSFFWRIARFVCHLDVALELFDPEFLGVPGEPFLPETGGFQAFFRIGPGLFGGCETVLDIEGGEDVGGGLVMVRLGGRDLLDLIASGQSSGSGWRHLDGGSVRAISSEAAWRAWGKAASRNSSRARSAVSRASLAVS